MYDGCLWVLVFRGNKFFLYTKPIDIFILMLYVLFKYKLF
jgi:hypothetical protein